MPIYEYMCEDCDTQFDKFVRSMSSQADVKCPNCGGTHTKKGWSVFGTAGSGGGMSDMAASAAGACGPAST